MRPYSGYGYVEFYAMSAAQPFVADALHRVGQGFTCQNTWQDDGDEQFLAAPLPADARYGFGYGRRTGAVISVTTTGSAALGEYTWVFGDSWMHQCGEQGNIRLDTHMSVKFDVDKSIAVSMQLDDGESRDGLVCEANEYQLPDGTTCLCLRPNPFVGELWLYVNNNTQPRQELQGMLVKNRAEFVYRGTRVVHLANASYGREMRSQPWKGITSRDESGRLWCVEQAKLTFRASLASTGLARNQQLRRHDPLVLMPPYQTVWSPPADDPESRIYIMLTFT